MNTKSSYKFILFLLTFMLLVSIPITLLIDQNLLFAFNTTYSLLAFGLPIVIYILVTKKSVKDTLNLNKISLRHIFFTIVCTYLFLPTANFIANLSSLFADNNVSTYLKTLVDLPFWQTLTILAILPAILEEFIMRGIFLSNFKKYPIFLVAVMNGLFFCILHLDFHQAGYTFIFGIYLTYLVYYTGSIVAPIISHFIFNSTTVINVYILKYIDSINTDFDLQEVLDSSSKISISDLATSLLIAIITGFIGYIIFKRQFINNPNLLYVEENDDIKSMINLPFYLCILAYVGFMVLNTITYYYS